MESIKNKNIGDSELRQDIVSDDWMVIATGRAKRPQLFINKKKEKFEQKTSNCPFENPQKSGHDEPVLIYKKGKDWSLQIIKNKYPILVPSASFEAHKEGPYNLIQGTGFHEVIITRDHKKHLAIMPLENVEGVIRAYQERYLALMNHKFVNYIFIFHNHGKEAGASIPHPHSQLIAMPILPADVRRSIEGAEKYYIKQNKCVHCEMIAWEKEEKRCIFQNEHFIVFAPFVPRVNFELRIYPKKHQSNFEKITEAERKSLAEAMQKALYALYKGLKNPDYNFFIHTAPCDDRDYKYYHWHIEILPKTNTWAGLELGTGVEVLTIKPEEVAEFLRKFNKK